MLLKIVIIALLIIMLYSLISAAYYMMKDRGNSDQVVKSLTWRIGLAFLIFVLLIVGFFFGWIAPNPGPFMLTN